MNFDRRTLLAAGAAGAASLVGGPMSALTAKTPYRQIDVPRTSGRLHGSVKYSGPPVEPRMVKVTKDQTICGDGSRSTYPMRVSDQGFVADAVVQIRGIEEGKPWDPVYNEAKIYQIDCGFQPFVQIVWDKADVYVVNLDPILHNIHAYEVFKGTRRSMFNFSQPRMGQEDRIPLRLRRGNLITLDCNAHGWMEGWVYTSPSPYVAITSTDGQFEIPDIPPGQYVLSVWHPFLGEKFGNLSVGDNADLNFDLVLS